METNRTILTLTTLLLCFATAFAQPKKEEPDKEALKMEAQANEFMKAEKFYKARIIFEKLDSLYPNNPKYIYPLGVCYVNLDMNIEALRYLEACLKKPSAFPGALNYYAAQAFHLSHRFDEAIKYYERYKNFVKKSQDKNAARILQRLNRQIEMCNNGKELMRNRLYVDVFNISREINSPYPDYRPVISQDESQIIFTSCRPNTTGGQKDEQTGYYYEDIYISTRTDSGWSKPVQMNENINTSGHDAAVSISPAGDKLILYRYGKDKMIAAASGDLYISELQNGKWAKAVKLSENINSPHWEPSASLSADGRMMFFTSNRPGGFGGTDLYSVKLLPNGEWALPVNLGPVINTSYDEDSPYIHPDGKTLYFSSNGHNSMGGYDIFVSHYNEERKAWSKPENIGYPISTAHDDIFFSVSADGKRVYFSSVRTDGEGDKDLYYALIKDEGDVLVIKGTIADSSNRPLQANIRVSDKNTGELFGIFTSDSGTGTYLMLLNEGKQYEVVYEAEKFNSIISHIDLTELHDYKELERNVLLPSE